MIKSLLPVFALGLGGMTSSAFAAPSQDISAIQLQTMSAIDNPIKPAVLVIPLNGQRHNIASHSTPDPVQAVAPATVQWLSGPLPLHCQKHLPATSVTRSGSCLVI